MFITCLTKDFSCFSFIEQANNDPGILTLDKKARKSLSVSGFVYVKYYVTLCYIFRLEIKNVLWLTLLLHLLFLKEVFNTLHCVM